MSKGWISIHRKLQHHWLWGDKPFSKGQAWIDLLMSANHEDCKFLLGSQLVDAKKGDVITSEVKLMDKWGWSKAKVRAFLTLLEKDSMIIKKTDSKKTTLSLTNYGVWQDSQTAKEPLKDHLETAERPLKDHLETTKRLQKDTINNSNNTNNSNNSNKDISNSPQNKFADDSIEFILASELFNLILGNNPKAKKPNLQSWAKDIDKMIRLDDRRVEEVRSVIAWSQRDTFWQGNILSTATLRKQFDKLTVQMRTRGGQVSGQNQPNRPKSFDAIDQWYDMTKGMIEE